MEDLLIPLIMDSTVSTGKIDWFMVNSVAGNVRSEVYRYLREVDGQNPVGFLGGFLYQQYKDLMGFG